MGGNDQLKALIRQGFAEKNIADRADLDVQQLLARVMLNVRRLVETLPEENLLRTKSWADLEDLVLIEMAPYAQGLRQSITQQIVAAGPDMEAYAIRQAEYAGATITKGVGAATPANVIAAVDRAVIGEKRFRDLFMSKAGPVTPWTNSMFKVVDRTVRAGIIEGKTTEAIADDIVHETISRGVPGVSLRGKTSVRTIRAQSMAMARTVTADVSRQVREQVYAANSEAMEDMVYLFSAALDSKTCPTCAAYDQERWSNEADTPTTPIHPQCRCQVLAIDPEDEFWDAQRRNGQQISTKPYTYKGKPIDQLSRSEKAAARNKGHYVTKTKVKGEEFYRKAVPFTGDSYSDYLASSNLTTQAEFFGGGKAGMRRARYFRDQIDKVNKDPRDILVSMLNGPTQARRFIPLKTVTLAKPKPKVKPKPALIVKPKPVAKAATRTQASSTVAINPKKSFDNSKESLGAGFFGEVRKTKNDVVKYGNLTENEITAMRKLEKTGIAPKIKGIEWEDADFKKLMNMKTRKGYLQMTEAKGKPLSAFRKESDKARIKGEPDPFTIEIRNKALDGLIDARKAMHKNTVAHFDLHAGNVMFSEKTGKVQIIDFGGAQFDPRTVLLEAIGFEDDASSVFSLRAIRGNTNVLEANQKLQRFRANAKKVDAKLRAKGLGDYVDNEVISLNPAEVNLSEAEALRFIDELYDGV